MSRIALLVLLSTLVGIPLATQAGAVNAATSEFATPPRLSLVNGPVSFWRPGTGTWQSAVLNTPLAPGDALATSERANLELQFGARAWLRAANATEISLGSNLPDLTALALAAGVASVDVRGLAPGHMVEVVTPHATLFIRDPGYYRIATSAEATRLTVRRGGQALLRSAATRVLTVQAGEEVLVLQADPAAPQLFAAPAADEWDRWNASRGDAPGGSVSAQHVAPEVYGLAELDRHGTWRHDGAYGPVWTPNALPAGWTPYGAGRWIEDPVFGQTWLDDAPWGYAPFHYGRWIDLGGTWAWAPGPRLARPAYAPALVGWIGDQGVQVGWVALGWGEPVLPWWGPTTFVGRPHWGGWGGPRLINHAAVGHVAFGRDLPAIRYVNARTTIVRTHRADHAFGTRPDFARHAGHPAEPPRNTLPDHARARMAEPVMRQPAPAPRPVPPAAPVTAAPIPVASPPSPPQINREPRLRESDAHGTRERHGRHPATDMSAPVQAQPPAQAGPPLAGRPERSAATPPPAPPAAMPAPAVSQPPTRAHVPGDHRHERRAEAAMPPPRAANNDNAGQGQVMRRDESARAAPGGPRREGARPEGADRKPRP